MSTTSKRKGILSRLKQKISIQCFRSESSSPPLPPSPPLHPPPADRFPVEQLDHRIPSPNLRFSHSFSSDIQKSQSPHDVLELHFNDKLAIGHFKDSDGRDLSLATTSAGSASQTGGYGDVQRVEEPEEMETRSPEPQPAIVDQPQPNSVPTIPSVAIQDHDNESTQLNDKSTQDVQTGVVLDGPVKPPFQVQATGLTITTAPPRPPVLSTLSPLTPTPAISLQPPSPASPHPSSSPITFDSPMSEENGFSFFKGPKEDLRKDLIRRKSLNKAVAPQPEILTFDSPTEEKEDIFADLKGVAVQKKLDRREQMRLNKGMNRSSLGKLVTEAKQDEKPNGERDEEEPETVTSPIDEPLGFTAFASPISAPEGYQMFGGAPGGLSVDGQDDEVMTFASPLEDPEEAFPMFRDPIPSNGNSSGHNTPNKLEPLRTSTLDLAKKDRRGRHNPSISISEHNTTDDLLTTNSIEDEPAQMIIRERPSASPISFSSKYRRRSDASSTGGDEEEVPRVPNKKERTFSTTSSVGSSVFSPSRLDVPSPATTTSSDGKHHRRQSSSHSVKETRNATSTSNPDGTRNLNQYKLIKKLGRGAYGSVELAVDTETNIQYAVKEFSKSVLRKRARAEMLRGPKRRNRYLKVQDKLEDPMELIKGEVAVMKKLDHPNIVKLFEVLDSTSDSLFMVIELCPGGSLMRLEVGKQSTPLSEADARHYFRQIVLGLEYLHFNDIAHRDIKPDNILLMGDEERTCKIVDFGVSEVFDKHRDDSSNKNAGSPAFQPPESSGMATGSIHGFQSDIWAAGVTLYSLVIGRLPFDSAVPMELWELICNTEPVYPEGLSKSLKNLLTSMMEKNPEKRASIEDIREHVWLTNDGKEPMISKDDNVTYDSPIAIDEIDLREAFRPINTTVAVMKAIAKMRRKTKSMGTTDLTKAMGKGSSNDSFDGLPATPENRQLLTPPKKRDTLSVEDAEAIILQSPDRFLPSSPVTEIPLCSTPEAERSDASM